MTIGMAIQLMPLAVNNRGILMEIGVLGNLVFVLILIYVVTILEIRLAGAVTVQEESA